MTLKLNMSINFSRQFVKQYRRAPTKICQHFDKKFLLFKQNPHHQLLNNHKLRGKYFGFRSINVTGDWRAIYSEPKKNIIIFAVLGTHSQLYK